MQFEYVLITPEMASTMLEQNTSNRKVRMANVKSIANDIKLGNWKTTHQPIAFDKQLKLIDGQHRLMAIVLSGVPCLCIVAYSVDSDTYDCIDIGAKRSNYDVLGGNKKVVACASYISTFKTGIPATPQSANEILVAFNKQFSAIGSFMQRGKKYTSLSSIAAAAIIQMKATNHEKYISEMYDAFTSNDFSNMPNIAQVFLRWLMEGYSKPHGETFLKALRVFNYHDRNLTRIIISDPVKLRKQARDVIIDALNT